MYSFCDTTEKPPLDSLPTEALFINGVCIESQIAGYRTLGTTGREGFELELETSGKILGRDGELLLSSRYPARRIGISYALECPDAVSFRARYNELNPLLQRTRQGAVFSFADEPDYRFSGVIQSFESVEEGSNRVAGRFQLWLPSPFKRSSTKEQTAAGGLTISKSLAFPVRPDWMQVRFSKSCDWFSLTNETTGQRMLVLSPFQAGDVFRIDWENGILRKNKDPITHTLDVSVSDFLSFQMVGGDRLLVLPAEETVTIGYREALL